MGEGEHVIHQLVELFEAADGFLRAAGQIRRIAVRQRHLRGVKQRGGQRRADLMRESRGQFAQRQQALLTHEQHLHEVRLSHIGEQHHFAAIVELAPGHIDEPAAAQLGVLTHPGGIDGCARAHRRKELPEQRRTQQFEGRRIEFLDLAAAIEHQHAARQALDQGRQARGKMFLAGVRFRQIGAELGQLGAQRIEGARQLVRNRPEGQERRLKFGATVFDQLEFCGCHASGRKQLLCLGSICSAYQLVTK